MMYTMLERRPVPMRKLSGLMSRWMKDFEWMYSMRSSVWSAIMSTVFCRAGEGGGGARGA